MGDVSTGRTLKFSAEGTLEPSDARISMDIMYKKAKAIARKPEYDRLFTRRSRERGSTCTYRGNTRLKMELSKEGHFARKC